VVADVRRHRPLANSSGTVDYSVHCTELHRLNMTLMALVSADRRAMSKPLTIASSEKPRRWVMRGARSTFLSSSKLKQSGYCSKHLHLDSLSYTHCSPAKQKSSSCTGVACLSSKACCQCSMLFTCMHMSRHAFHHTQAILSLQPCQRLTQSFALHRTSCTIIGCLHLALRHT